MTMTGKERAALRSECNRLKTTVHIGHAGADDAAVEARDLVVPDEALAQDRLVDEPEQGDAAVAQADEREVVGAHLGATQGVANRFDRTLNRRAELSVEHAPQATGPEPALRRTLGHEHHTA